MPCPCGMSGPVHIRFGILYAQHLLHFDSFFLIIHLCNHPVRHIPVPVRITIAVLIVPVMAG
jgi:hypothetical protein